MSSKIPGSNSSSSTSFIDNLLVDAYYPIRSPLAGKYKKNFGFKTIGYRLPVILTKIIDQLSQDKNEIGKTHGTEAREEVKDIVGRIAKLKNELQTNKSITPIENDDIWNTYISFIASKYHDGIVSDVTFYISPWLFVECYIYHRIHLAFTATIHLRNFDYFRKQKEESFLEAINQANVLGDHLLSTKPTEDILQSFLELSLWGNRCDLSLSAGALTSYTGHLVDQLEILRASIICNNSADVWKCLQSNANGSDARNTLGYILDNSGFELFTDLCLADLLLKYVDQIDFYVKSIPWFISDTMHHDFDFLFNTMESSEYLVLKQLAQKWKEFLITKRWRVLTFEFWTLPHTFAEMKITDHNLYSALAAHKLLIFKGDLNYRKLVGDINWEPETPFREALQGFVPAPLVALRTCKADVVAGLRPGLAQEIHSKDPNWLTTGEFGLIQFVSS